MLTRTEYNQLAMKNRGRMAELEQHLDNAQRLYHEIAQPVYGKTITYSPESFVGINGGDMAVIETEVKMLAANIRLWGCLEDKLFHETTFCSADNGFVQGEHSVCDPASEGKEGECLTGDALRRYESQRKEA